MSPVFSARKATDARRWLCGLLSAHDHWCVESAFKNHVQVFTPLVVMVAADESFFDKV